MFFSNSIFCQTYNPTPYDGYAIGNVFADFNFNPWVGEFRINCNVMYFGPYATIYDYTYREGVTMMGTDYTYNEKRKVLTMTDSPKVIYVCPISNNKPCTNPLHSKTPDWASKAEYSAKYWLEIKKQTIIYGTPVIKFFLTNGTGIASGTKYYYKGNGINI
ncbi:hypothetical protein MKD41_04800 [Lutibacter sp. A64]|uniref:hypothetical protein n=1 Tax=Lutibacter sp. A64 TaxID=2918526 RepID=UPI001F068664|nr:hypothetical protein [Lutibacter sp. A64]UMB54792.1 hypothetical protein MKD41_04800 [Lutibacter sp. A64]